MYHSLQSPKASDYGGKATQRLIARVDLSIRSCIPPAQARLSVVFSANEVPPFLNSHQSQTGGECGGGVDLPNN